jgi:DNA-binding NarL/FixJ family response regulator
MLTMSAASAYADGMTAIDELGRAAQDGDHDVALRAVARLRRLTEQLEAERVAAARRAGWSWQDIALRLGVTKQTVHRKHRHGEED